MTALGGAEPARGGTSLGILFAGFAVTGVVTVLLGPLLPELSARWGLAPATAAWLFVAWFAASSLGAVFSSLHLHRSLVAGYASIALGLAGLAAAPWPAALVAAGLCGLGLGLVIPASNLAVARRARGGAGAALSLLNLVWGAGAVGCPLLFAALRGRAPAAVGLWGLAGLAVTVALFLAAFPAVSAGGSRRSGVAAPAATGATGVPLVLLAAMLFLYVGIENAVGGWLVTLADRVGQVDELSMLLASGFWISLLSGRAAAVPLLRRLSEPKVYAVALAVAAVGVTATLLAPSRPLLLVAAAVTGAGLGPLFPLTASSIAAGTAERARSAGAVFALGGLGAAVLPWLTGQAGEAAGLRQAFLVPLAGILLLAAAFVLEQRLRSPGRGDCTAPAAPRRDPGDTLKDWTAENG